MPATFACWIATARYYFGVASPLTDIVRSVAPTCEISDDLEPLLADRLARAAAAWPTAMVEPGRFMRAIAERLAAERPAVLSVEAMKTDDLYLACGCADGDPAALAAFEAHCGVAVARAIAASGASPAEQDDLGQVVRQRLLVTPAGGGAPRISTYSARGSLVSWVRVVATHEVVRVVRRVRPERTGDDALANLIAPDDDPEIGYLKRLYRGEFKRAFRAAIEALGDRERVLLAQHVLDDLSIDQVAALHRVSRATAARWLQAARAAVLDGTQRELIRRLRLSRTELASVMRLIESQLEVSLSGLLGRESAAAERRELP